MRSSGAIACCAEQSGQGPREQGDGQPGGGPGDEVQANHRRAGRPAVARLGQVPHRRAGEERRDRAFDPGDEGRGQRQQPVVAGAERARQERRDGQPGRHDERLGQHDPGRPAQQRAGRPVAGAVDRPIYPHAKSAQAHLTAGRRRRAAAGASPRPGHTAQRP